MAGTLVILAIVVAGASSSTRVQAAPGARASKAALARQLTAARELCEQKRAGAEVPEPGLRVLELRVGGMEYLFLLQARGDAWSAAGRLAELWSPGAFGRHGQFGGVSAHRESVGAHNLLWFRVRAASHDEDLGVNEVSFEETETETICILGAASEAPRCPLSVPIRSTHERRQLHDPGDLTEEEIAKVREHGTKGLPIHRSQTLRIDVGEDGVAQVVLVEGTEPGDVTLGLHRLW